MAGRLQDVIQRNTRANQPAATAVPAGTLYYVTDETVLERSTGSAWESYSATTAVFDEDAQDAVGGILTDTATIDFTYTDAGPTITADVKDGSITYAKIQNISATDKVLGRSTAGAGSTEEIACTAAGRAILDDATAGDQRTTLGLGALATLASVGSGQIDNDAVTYAKIQNVSAASRLLGRGSAAGAGDTEEIALGSGLSMSGTTLSTTASGTGEWDFEVVAASDQDVTNSSTLTDDTELIRAGILANEVWIFELLIAYSATDETRDFKWSLACSAGTMTGWHNHVGLGSSNLYTNSGLSCLAAAAFSGVVNGTEAAQAIRPLYIKAMVTFSSNCTFKFQFAEDGVGAGTVARREAGSLLRGTKVV